MWMSKLYHLDCGGAVVIAFHRSCFMGSVLFHVAGQCRAEQLARGRLFFNHHIYHPGLRGYHTESRLAAIEWHGGDGGDCRVWLDHSNPFHCHSTSLASRASASTKVNGGICYLSG